MNHHFRQVGLGSFVFLISLASFSLATEAQQLPFGLRKHLIVVRNSVGELDALHFVVDTGATDTFISRRPARKLELKGETERALAFGREIKMQKVILPDLVIGSVRLYE